MNLKSLSTILFFLTSILIFFLYCFDLSKSTIAILILLYCLGLWIFEILPSAITALLVPVFSISNGILLLDDAFSVFGSPVIVLLVCVLILTRTLAISGLSERVAVFLISSPYVGNSIRSLCFSLAFFCWLLAWWMSNTAVSALFLPIVMGILPQARKLVKEEHLYEKVKLRLLMTCAFVPSLGGMVTPVGSLPNLVSIEALRESGVNISFINWISYGLPISFVFLLCLMLVFEFLFHVPSISLSAIKADLEKRRNVLPKFSYKEKVVIISFFLTVILWLLPGVVDFFQISSLIEFKKKITVTISAIIGVVTMFFLLSLEREDRIKWKEASNFDWGIVLLFSGGLCLGKAMISAGVPEVVFQTSGVEGALGSTLALYVIPITVLLSEFCSNTVAASILVPFVISINQSDIILPIITALSAGFGFMLPISTPPNALVFATGEVPLKKMIMCGLLFDLIGMVVLFGYYLLLA